jgi:hypothetical protein
MKKILLALTAFALASMVAVSQTPAAPKHKTIFALTEPEGSAWNVLFLHVQNLQEDLTPYATEVDSAVAELTRRQEADYAYIH